MNQDAYSGASPARWEIISFQLSPQGPVLTYRVVGLPGDTVLYDEKKLLHINGVAVSLAESDLKIPTEFKEEHVFVESFQGHSHFVQTRDGAPVVMLDAVENFADRDLCSCSPDGFRCVIPAGKYFVMGDNRDSSRDSRYRGFVPIGKILGRVDNPVTTVLR